MELPEEVKHIDQEIIKSWIIEGYKKYLKNQLSDISISSIQKGNIGEDKVKEILNADSIKNYFSGDLYRKDILIEVKNYNSCVPYAECEKFYRDMSMQNFSGGFFVSLSSSIGKVGTFYFNKEQHCMFISSSNKELLKSAFDILVNFIDSLKFLSNQDSEKLRKQVLKLEEISNLSEIIRGIERLRKYNDTELNRLNSKLKFCQNELDRIVGKLSLIKGGKIIKTKKDIFINMICEKYESYHIVKNLSTVREILPDSFEYSETKNIISINSELTLKILKGSTYVITKCDITSDDIKKITPSCKYENGYITIPLCDF